MKVCVIGLGRIGLPTAAVVANKGHVVFGVDVSEVIERVSKKVLPFHEPGLSELLETAGEHFRPTVSMRDGVNGSDVVLICVGTRRYADKKPDLTVIERLVGELTGTCTIRNKLIVFKTTFPIGTTRRLVSKIELSTGLRCEEDFFAGFCPERMVEGNAVAEVGKLPKIVSGIGAKSLEKAMEFYGTIGGTLVPVTSTETAETVKLIDNAYRITKFAFANEIALLAEENALNAYEIIRAANTDYPRNDIPTPSCGVGGFCLTKDPWYLEEAFAETAKRRGFHSLWFYSRVLNDFQIRWTADRVERALNEKGVRLEGSGVLICGVTYKANIDDVRDSHGLFLAQELKARQAVVDIWDPHLKTPIDPSFQMHVTPDRAFTGKDAAIFTVKHREFVQLRDRLPQLAGLMKTKILFDGAMVFENYEHPEIIFLRTGVANKVGHASS